MDRHLIEKLFLLGKTAASKEIEQKVGMDIVNMEWFMRQVMSNMIFQEVELVSWGIQLLPKCQQDISQWNIGLEFVRKSLGL